MPITNLIYFSVAWVAGVYLVNCLLALEWKKVEPKTALLFITTVSMIGTFGEIFWDTLYQKAFGSLLWEYYILPIHGGRTSLFAIVLWGFYGFHLYLLYDTIKRKYKKAFAYLPLIFSFEALVIEALVSLTFLAIFGRWIYYYLPNGLWHVSAFQNFPLYVMAGYVIYGALKRFQKDPYFFILMNIALTITIAYLV